MTTYTPFGANDLAVDRAVTQFKMEALRDNPIAMGEGSAGAPLIYAGWHPYNLTAVGGSQTGEFYNFSLDGATASVLSPDFVDGFEYGFVFLGLGHSSGTRTFEVEYYMEESDSYVVIGTTGDVAASETFDGVLAVPFPRLEAKAHSFIWLKGWAVDGLGGNSGGNSQVTGIATASKVLRARFSWDGGVDFDAGSMRMIRRREYVTG